MKKIAYYMSIIILLTATASCEKNLAKLNVNETNSTTLDAVTVAEPGHYQYFLYR